MRFTVDAEALAAADRALAAAVADDPLLDAVRRLAVVSVALPGGRSAALVETAAPGQARGAAQAGSTVRALADDYGVAAAGYDRVDSSAREGFAMAAPVAVGRP